MNEELKRLCKIELINGDVIYSERITISDGCAILLNCKRLEAMENKIRDSDRELILPLSSIIKIKQKDVDKSLMDFE